MLLALFGREFLINNAFISYVFILIYYGLFLLSCNPSDGRSLENLLICKLRLVFWKSIHLEVASGPFCLLFFLFLASEALLFISFFWASFHSLSSPTLGI